MNKNRYLLYLLLCGLMLYFALPTLPINEEGAGSIFSVVWLAVLLFAFAGNLSALLFSAQKDNQPRFQSQQKKKNRQFSYYKLKG